ncbi:MAG: BrnT family toxin [Acidobacteriaceae bacterium]|nr:BrnT family toxin [Acidobacteriaceae bacterium]MBV9765950.1 BrnT family toxin [Acidobacteriaceae bacterium]
MTLRANGRKKIVASILNMLQTVFLDPERLESIGYERGREVRYHTVGKAAFGEILFIVFTWRQHAEEQVCRIISARIAHSKERQRYTGVR